MASYSMSDPVDRKFCLSLRRVVLMILNEVSVAADNLAPPAVWSQQQVFVFNLPAGEMLRLKSLIHHRPLSSQSWQVCHSVPSIPIWQSHVNMKQTHTCMSFVSLLLTSIVTIIILPDNNIYCILFLYMYRLNRNVNR